MDVLGFRRGAHTMENGKESHQGSEPDTEEKIRWIDGNVFVIKFVLRYVLYLATEQRRPWLGICLNIWEMVFLETVGIELSDGMGFSRSRDLI